MKKSLNKFLAHTGITAGIMAAVIIVASLGVSWITACGIIKLITLCFGWTFSWGIATGIWLVMCLLSSVFKSNVTVKK